MKILILGGTGFVGRNVCEVFSKSPHDVRQLSKRDGLDLMDYEGTKRFVEDAAADVIINLAAKVGSLNYVTQQAAEIFDTNMRILLNVFKVLQEVSPRSILMNPIANCAYPGNLENYSEEKFWDGRIHQSVLAYGSTRRMIDVLSDCYKMQYGLTIINYFVPNMYGPYDSTDPNKAHALNALVSKFVKAKHEHQKAIEVWGSGIAIREWLFAKDFGRILLSTMNRLNEYVFSETFNVGQNFGLSVKELVNLIQEHTGYEGKICWNKNMPDGAPRKVMNDIRFRKIFPEFQFTDFKSGVVQTIEYYESIYPY